MNALLSLRGIELWQLAGWTMVHFLWLGALVAVAAAGCRVLLRRAQPNVRYAFTLAWLLALAALPLAAAAWLYQNSPPLKGGAGGGILTANTPPTPIVLQPSSPIIELHQPEANTAAATSAPAPPSASGASPNLQPAISVPLNPPQPSRQPTTSWLSTLNSQLSTLTALIPYLPWLWLIGTPLTFALLLTGIVGTRRLNRASHTLTDGPIPALLSQLVKSLRIGQRVTVAVCDRIAAPVLIGIIRPVILLPPAALTGWSPDEIEMVLLHELAHVRRLDNFINLLQRMVESLLFFHPAVWIVSSWVRNEREACCDALVVRRTNRPHAYATLLVNLAASIQPSPSGRGQGEGAFPAARGLALHSAMAAGPLRSRIRRILQLEDDPMLVSGKSLTLVFGALALAATLGVLYVPTIGEAKEKPAKTVATTVEQSSADVEGASVAGRPKQTLPPVPPTSDPAAEALSKNNLRSIVLAAMNYEAAKTSLPPHAIYSADGKPLLSWRVALLPYLGPEEQELYKQFHLDEPWDSEHNRKLVARIPILYVIPKVGLPPVYAGKTNYLAVVGPECAFDGTAKGRKFEDIADGTAHTIAFVEANVDQAVEWTKPDDWKFDRNAPTSGLGTVWTGHWNAAFMDGSQQQISNNTPADTAGIFFTRAGGETKSLAESAGHAANKPGVHEGAVLPTGEPASAGVSTGPEGGFLTPSQSTSKFPSLEDQKLADIAFKRLNLELEPIGPDDLKRVKALGYDGGVKIAHTTNLETNSILTGDILVGLHVWPTTSVKDVVDVLKRDDLAELNPLKFYVIRQDDGVRNVPGTSITITNDRQTGRDRVVTGRYSLYINNAFGNAATPWKSDTSRRPPERQPFAPPPSDDAPENPFQLEPNAPGLHSTGADRYGPQAAPAATFATPGAATPPPNTLTPTPRSLSKDPSPAVGERSLLTNDTANGLQPASADRVPARNAPTPNTAAARGMPATAAGDDKSNLRYDGKTFSEWRNVWQTELSTEKRLQAIKALAAFGRAGYGKEATETILDVAGEYDFYILEGKESPEGALKETVLDELAPYYRPAKLAKYWVPEISVRLQQDPDKWRSLTAQLLSRLNTQDPEAVSKLYELATTGPDVTRRMALYALVNSERRAQPRAEITERTRKLIDEALNSQNKEVTMSAFSLLFDTSNFGMGGGGMGGAEKPALFYRPALLPLMLDTNDEIRRRARQVMSSISEKDSGDAVKYLLDALNDKSHERDRLEVVRGLAAIARGGRLHMEKLNAVAELQKICKDPKSDDQLFVAALIGLDGVYGPLPSSALRRTNIDRGALAKLFGGSSEEELEAIAKRINDYPHSIGAAIDRETAIIFNGQQPNSANNPAGGAF